MTRSVPQRGVSPIFIFCNSFEDWVPIGKITGTRCSGALKWLAGTMFEATAINLSRHDLLEHIFPYCIHSAVIKLFKLGTPHQSMWRWNMGFHKDQYLNLFYLPFIQLHLVISSAIMVWISRFMLMIRNFIYHLCQVIQYLDRPPYLRPRPASRTSKQFVN